VRARAASALLALDAGRYASGLLPPAADPVPAPDDPLAPLSDREREVAALLLEGLSYAQIAKELFVTRSTVAFHLSNVYAKTGTSTRHEFVQLARPAQRPGSGQACRRAATSRRSRVVAARSTRVGSPSART
jgi:DNA-binding CsgD family transcriptional regulator